MDPQIDAPCRAAVDCGQMRMRSVFGPWEEKATSPLRVSCWDAQLENQKPYGITIGTLTMILTLFQVRQLPTVLSIHRLI